MRSRTLWAMLLIGAAGMLLGCPKPPPPVVVIPDAADAATPPGVQDMSHEPAPLPACTPAAKLKQEDICDGFFTQDGLSCARCSNVKGCVDPTVVMYCATGPCADDPLCRYVPNPLLKAGKPTNAGKKSTPGKR